MTPSYPLFNKLVWSIVGWREVIPLLPVLINKHTFPSCRHVAVIPSQNPPPLMFIMNPLGWMKVPGSYTKNTWILPHCLLLITIFDIECINEIIDNMRRLSQNAKHVMSVADAFTLWEITTTSFPGLLPCSIYWTYKGWTQEFMAMLSLSWIPSLTVKTTPTVVSVESRVNALGLPACMPFLCLFQHNIMPSLEQLDS